jgi:hypothetical protein
MKPLDQAIDQAFSDLKSTCGGVRNDYFGIVYLEREFRIPREEALNQVAFGGNDYGIDGFHFDLERKNLYLLQFKYSDSHTQFKGSFQRLIDAGIERIFDAKSQDAQQNQLLLQLHSCLLENQSIIERVYIHFIFLGDPAEAERSQVLDKLREDLENHKYIIDKYFERQITLVIEYRSAQTRKAGPTSHQRKTRTYELSIEKHIERKGPKGENLLVGFVPLMDIHKMYKEMGQRFFERNIRAALPESEAVNRAITKAFRRIIIDPVDDPSVFSFNHNGVSFAAEKIEPDDGMYKVTEPRLLNGAQTVTTFARFLKDNEDHPALKENKNRLEGIKVLCKIISEADQPFVTTVTINNNRQNPVEPWNLHANDFIQLELQDKFRDDLGIYYERQEQAFEGLSDEELDESGIQERTPITLLRLTQTFLVVDGDIDKMSSIRRVFEDDKIYDQVFNNNKLSADTRKIVLCYKIQLRLRKFLKEIIDRGPSKYDYMHRARYLIWALLAQGLLNDDKLDKLLEEYGNDMTIPVNYTEKLSQIATTKVRFIVKELVRQKEYASKIEDGNYSFLRTNSTYKRAMEIAYKKWHWVEKKLK